MNVKKAIARLSIVLFIASTVYAYDPISSEILKNVSNRDNTTSTKEAQAMQDQLSGDFYNLQEAESDVDNIYASLEDVSQELNNLTKERNELNTKYAETKREIVRVIQDTQDLKDEIKNNIIKIKMTNIDISNKKKEIKANREDIVRSKEQLKNFTNFLYKLSNDFYSSHNNGSA